MQNKKLRHFLVTFCRQNESEDKKQFSQQKHEFSEWQTDNDENGLRLQWQLQWQTIKSSGKHKNPAAVAVGVRF